MGSATTATMAPHGPIALTHHKKSWEIWDILGYPAEFPWCWIGCVRQNWGFRSNK
jgi:hypothetical protein